MTHGHHTKYDEYEDNKSNYNEYNDTETINMEWSTIVHLMSASTTPV